MQEKIIKYMTPCLFLLIIFGFAIINIVTPDKTRSESENINLQQLPKFTVESLFAGSFTADFEKYVQQQFVGRDEFIGVKSTTDFLIGKRDSNTIYFGSDGYLFKNFPTYTIDDYLLNKNLERINTFVNTTTFTGDIAVLLAPTSSQILTEKLPTLAYDYDQLKAYDGIKNTLPTGTFVESTANLLEHKDEDIYFKTDHHWTTLGAYYAYRALCDTLGIEGTTLDEYEAATVSENFYGTLYSNARLPTTKPDNIDVYIPKFETEYSLNYNFGEKRTDSLYDESYLNQRDQYSYFLGGNQAIVEITSQNKNGKKLLMLKDSYSHAVVPFLVNDYETIVMVDLRFYNGSFNQYLGQGNFTSAALIYNFETLATDVHLAKILR